MSKKDCGNVDSSDEISSLLKILEGALAQADALEQQLAAIHIQTAIEVLRPEVEQASGS